MSSDPEATSRPSGEKATAVTEGVALQRPQAPRSRIPQPDRLSSDPEATSRPSGEKATVLTEPEWPSSVRSRPCLRGSHSRTVCHRPRSYQSAVRREGHRVQTGPEWPSSVRTAVPVAGSHSRTVLSLDPEATSRPSGEKATVPNTRNDPPACRMRRPSADPTAGPSRRWTQKPPAGRPARRPPW